MLKIILISLCLISLVNSQKWTADLGQQYPGITPLFSQLDDGIAIASLLQDSDRTFHLLVHRYSIQGKLEFKCDLTVPTVSKRIWDLKIQQTSDSSLALSWLYSDGTELGVRVLRVNVTLCSLRDARVPLYGDLDLVLYVPHYLMSRGNAGLYLFVKSTDICEGVCRFEIVSDGEIFTRDGTFISAQDDSLVWRILAVNSSDPSAGYYYIREEDSPNKRLAKIEKLNSSGTLLRALATNASADGFAVSSSHARLSACSSSSGCFLLDPRTFQSKPLNVSDDAVSTMVNTKDGGVVVIDEASSSAMKFRSDGSLVSSVEVLKDFDVEGKCFPRKMYQAVEVADDVFCVGRACMRKRNATADAFYRVAVAVECLRIP